jgi:hypothetical protein
LNWELISEAPFRSLLLLLLSGTVSGVLYSLAPYGFPLLVDNFNFSNLSLYNSEAYSGSTFLLTAFSISLLYPTESNFPFNTNNSFGTIAAYLALFFSISFSSFSLATSFASLTYSGSSFQFGIFGASFCCNSFWKSYFAVFNLNGDLLVLSCCLESALF